MLPARTAIVKAARREFAKLIASNKWVISPKIPFDFRLAYLYLLCIRRLPTVFAYYNIHKCTKITDGA